MKGYPFTIILKYRLREKKSIQQKMIKIETFQNKTQIVMDANAMGFIPLNVHP
jgi:hypothetical protein